MKAGDRLMWRQWEASGTTAGLVMGFTDGTQNWSPGVNLVDQHGEGLHPSAISPQWVYRIGNLSPAAGKTISYFAVGAGGYGAGLWDWYYQDMVFVGADGTVIPLYNHNQTISLYGFGSSGMTQGGYEINHDPNATSYSWWASTMYYHGDQIGSSRLMTSDGGWPVWQGTFLPYGEEYNQQITTNHYKFTGKERDSESGLDYFGARYYSSLLGRFMSDDWSATPEPVPYADFGDPQALNLYSYVRNIPTTRVDLDGHDDSVLSNFLDAGMGFARGAVSSVTFGAVGAPKSTDSVMSLWGQSAGTGMVETLGLQSMATGGTEMGVGLGAELPSEGTSTALVLDGAGQVVVGGVMSVGAAKNSTAILNAMAAKGGPPNPNGSAGAPDHQTKVNELKAQAEGEAKAGEKVESNTKVKGLDSTRRPDVHIINKQGKTRKAFEA